MPKPHDSPEADDSPATDDDAGLDGGVVRHAVGEFAGGVRAARRAGSRGVVRGDVAGAGDEGVATVWAAVAITALAAVLAVVVGVGAAVVARHRAAAAADLAALAGAAHAWSGAEVACARAEEVVSRMAAELRVCELSGLEVTVRVARRGPGFGWAEVSARAGPVGSGISVAPKSRGLTAGRRDGAAGRAVGRARRTAGGSRGFSYW